MLSYSFFFKKLSTIKILADEALFQVVFWCPPARYYRDHLEQHEPLLRKVEEGFMCQELQLLW